MIPPYELPQLALYPLTPPEVTGPAFVDISSTLFTPKWFTYLEKKTPHYFSQGRTFIMRESVYLAMPAQ